MVILKISLAIFYLRIVVARWQKLTIYATVGIATIFGTYYFFAVLFECGMPADFLYKALHNECSGSKQTRFAINMTAGVINAVTDFILAALPLTLIRKAAVPLPAKVSAGLILLVGCTGSAVSLVRLAYIRGLNYSEDFFESGLNITIWSIVEAGLCITAASLATLRPLFHCCIDSARLPIGSKTFGSTRDFNPASFSELKSDAPHHNLSDSAVSVRAQEVRDVQSPTANWPLKPMGTTSEPRELDDLVPESGITRKASIQRGKVQWLDSRVETPSPTPPRRFRKPSKSRIPRVSSDDGPSPSPAQVSLNRAPRDQSSFASPFARNAAQPRMEEVGVGAWRVLDKAPERRPAGG